MRQNGGVGRSIFDDSGDVYICVARDVWWKCEFSDEEGWKWYCVLLILLPNHYN